MCRAGGRGRAHQELGELKRREIPRPPGMTPEGSQDVVQIHQHMHYAVEHDRKVHVSVEVFHNIPGGGMLLFHPRVVNAQEGHVKGWKVRR